MGRKSNSGCGVIGLIVIGLFSLLALIPIGVWVFIGIGVVLWLFYRFNSKKYDTNIPVVGEENYAPPQRDSNVLTKPVDRLTNKVQQPRAALDYQKMDAPRQLNPGQLPRSHPSSSSGFSIPPPPKIFSNQEEETPKIPAPSKTLSQPGRWVPTDESVDIAGFQIPGGMIYVGSSLPVPPLSPDPCLIDPLKPVSLGSIAEIPPSYWPSYSQISPPVRYNYLSWLQKGRSDPEADIGYVFLFFYGLERRVLVDGKNPDTRIDWPKIAGELHRLLSIYGDKSGSFRNYAIELLQFVELSSAPDKLYEKPLPEFQKSYSYQLPLLLRLTLGQAAVDKASVSESLALAWLKMDPNTYLRTPAKRCSSEFDQLFAYKYAKTFKKGFFLPQNRTKLKFVYRPASYAFSGSEEIGLAFGDIPDVTILAGPIQKLRDLAENCTKDLENYSRILARNPEAKSSLEGFLLLPSLLWPDDMQNAINNLRNRVNSEMVVLTFGELLAALNCKTTLLRERVMDLARVLESMNISMEPDVLRGAKPPKADEMVVLFDRHNEGDLDNSPVYQTALLTIQLASSIAIADGKFVPAEFEHTRQQIQSWIHLTPSHRRRLEAHLQLVFVAPMSLTKLKKKLELLNEPAKSAIAQFMVAVAQSDGYVAPEEVKLLEKVYKALGFSQERLFSDIHAATTGGLKSNQDMKIGLKLDSDRIASLQNDTEKISLLLANIFSEEDATVNTVTPPEAMELEEEQINTKGLLGLDEAHSSLVRLLLSRPKWAREDLRDVAADLDLMLDGALEHINEASFEMLDAPFVEGEDPLEINSEVREKIVA